MCYQVNPAFQKEQLEKAAKRKVNWEKTLDETKYKVSGFDFPQLGMLLKGTDETELIGTTAKWGLVPSWLNSAEKARELQPMTLNAKIETATKKPSFKDACGNRCLIPIAGFYEWRHDEKEKFPYYIYPNVGNVFFVAGLFSNWTNPETTLVETTCTVLTTVANDTMKYIHNTKERMPVILHPTELSAYLDPERSIEDFSAGCKSEMMLSYTINRLRMKNPIYDNDLLLLAEHVYDRPIQGSLF